MSRCQQAARPILRSLRQIPAAGPSKTCQTAPIGRSRLFSTSPSRRDEVTETTTSGDASKSADEAALRAAIMDVNSDAGRTPPVGSKRYRAAVELTGDLPFEQLPYQCFQEARKVLNQDREQKLAQIAHLQGKIAKLEKKDPKTYRNGVYHKEKKLKSLRQEVEELKIFADINDPLVKRRFEDGLGDMTKPIYRLLAKKKWESYDYLMIQQRIESYNIVPDVLPKFKPTMDVKLFARGRKIQPGAILDSLLTEVPPSLHMQVFDGGERLLTVVVMDSDVPLPEKDAYGKRLHFIATNIPWDPTKTALPLMMLGRSDANAARANVAGTLAVPWLPPTAQKGAPYHRLSIFVLEHEPGQTLDASKVKELYEGKRDAFALKSFLARFPGLKPVGFNIFRSVWDDHTADVMARHGIPGADVEFRRARVHSLKPPKKARGWEAKRQKAKYKSLWKYTKRIRPGGGGR